MSSHGEIFVNLYLDDSLITGQLASVFTQLLSSFTRLNIHDDNLHESTFLNTLEGNEASASAPLSALVDMVWKGLPLAKYQTTSPDFRTFIMTLLKVVNNAKGLKHIEPHMARIVLDSLQLTESRMVVMKLLEEHSPFFETLTELLFKYALARSNSGLTSFLLQHSHIRPNDRLQFEDVCMFVPTKTPYKSWVSSPCQDLLSFGQAVTPIEYAILTRSSSLLHTLCMSGVILDVQGRHGPDVLRRIDNNSSSFGEVLLFMLDEGLMSMTDASSILGEKFDTLILKRTFGETIQQNLISHLPAEQLLQWSIQNDRMSLADDLLEQGTTITEAGFFEAIQRGHLSIVNRALQAGADANSVDSHGAFPLRIAAERGDFLIVQSLLRHGAEIEPAWACSPMFWSIPSHEILKLFLKRGANHQVWDEYGFSPLCHFLLRRDPDAAMLLIDWGACLGRHPKRTPLWVPTPLQIAANKGYDAVVEKLLDRNIDVNEDPPLHNGSEPQDLTGDTALAGAIRNSWGRWTRLIDRLINEGADVNAVARYGDTPLSIALDHDDEAVVQSLVKAGASVADPEAFRAAATSGNLDFLCQSLEAGLCIDDVGAYALSNAVYSGKMHLGMKMRTVSFLIDLGARTGDMKLMQYFIEQNPELSQLLLSHGASPAEYEVSAVPFERYRSAQLRNNSAEVATALKIIRSMPSIEGELLKRSFLYGELILAAISGDVDMVKAHIDAVVNVASLRISPTRQATYNDRSALVVARLLQQNRPPSNWLPPARLFDHPEKHAPETPSQCLMTTGPQSSETDSLPELSDEGSQTSFLLGQTPDTGSSENANQCSPIYFDLSWPEVSDAEIIELESSDPDHCHLRKVTSECLLAAAVKGGPAVIELLHEVGLDVNGELSTLEGREFKKLHKTALRYAIQLGRYDSADALIQAGADVNAPADADRRLTALQAAAIHGHIGIACKLLKKGAEVNAPGGSFGGRTALEGAAEWGRLDMVQLLLDNGADITDSTFGETQYRNSTKFAKDEGYPAIARLIRRRRLSMGYSDLSCDDSV